MRMNLMTLKRDTRDFDKDSLFSIGRAETYQEGCCDAQNNTWVWNAKAWEQASLYLRSLVSEWTRKSKGTDPDHWFRRLKKECDKCVQDMAEYKRICSDPAGTSWGARMRQVVGLDAQLEALKLCV